MDTLNFSTYISADSISGIDNSSFEQRIKKIYDMLEGKMSSDWQCETFNTLFDYNLLDDEFFDDFHKKITEKVGIFLQNFGPSKGYKPVCKTSWFNVAFPGQNQEFHIHANSHISAVYYVKAPKNSGDIIFDSPMKTMFPLPYKDYSETRLFRTPVAGDVVMFKSNVSHMVATNKSDDVRISISMNFTVEKE
jgi:uncharacterized protein (TIGR02466 family)